MGKELYGLTVFLIFLNYLGERLKSNRKRKIKEQQKLFLEYYHEAYKLLRINLENRDLKWCYATEVLLEKYTNAFQAHCYCRSFDYLRDTAAPQLAEISTQLLRIGSSPSKSQIKALSKKQEEFLTDVIKKKFEFFR